MHATVRQELSDAHILCQRYVAAVIVLDHPRAAAREHFSELTRAQPGHRRTGGVVCSRLQEDRHGCRAQSPSQVRGDHALFVDRDGDHVGAGAIQQVDQRRESR